jgi:type I restriction enzyme S subunit
MKLPKGWKELSLRDLLLQPVSGVSVLANDNAPALGEPGVLRLSCVTNGRFNPKDLKTPEAGQTTRLNVAAEHDSILISRSNTPNLVGESAYVPDDHPLAFLPDTLWLLKPRNATEVSMAWLSYMLRSRRYKRLLQQISSGTSQSMKKIQKGAFLGLPAQTPPVSEQRKIASILTTWDHALERLDALIAAQDRRKKALMQQLLNGSTDLSARKENQWRTVPMGSLLKRVFRPINWSPDLPLSLVSIRRRCGGLFRRPPVLGTDYKTRDLHELNADDFLVSKRQVVHGAWGLVTDAFAGTQVSKEYAIFVNKAPTKLHMPFFGWLAQTPRMIHLARVACTGVHLEKMIFDPAVFLRESISIPVDIDEQKAIADVLDTCDDELALLRRQRDALDRQKRGLMQRLLTGQIRVKV